MPEPLSPVVPTTVTVTEVAAPVVTAPVAPPVMAPTAPAVSFASGLPNAQVNADGVSQSTAALLQAEPAVPLAWADLELPADTAVSPEIQAEFLSLLNEPPADRKAAAAATLALHTKLMDSAAAESVQQFENTQTRWRDEVRALPEFNGAKFEPALGEVAKLVNRYGSEQLREALTLTGAGNHPAVLQFLHKIARDINESQPVSGQPVVASRDLASRLYGPQS